MSRIVLINAWDAQALIERELSAQSLMSADSNYGSVFAAKVLTEYLFYACLLKNPESFYTYTEDLLGVETLNAFIESELSIRAYNAVLSILTFHFPNFKAYVHNTLEDQVHTHISGDGLVLEILCDESYYRAIVGHA